MFLCYVIFIYFFPFKAQKEIESLVKQEDRLVKKDRDCKLRDSVT